MRYLVVTSFDERYDLNFSMKIFNGTVDEYEEEDVFLINCKKELKSNRL